MSRHFLFSVFFFIDTVVNAFLYSVTFVLGTRKSFDHLISDTKAPKRQEMESGITTPPKMRRVAETDYEMGEKQS